MFDRPENWPNILQPAPNGPKWDVGMMTTNTLMQSLPRIVRAIVPPDRIVKGVYTQCPVYTNPDKVWLRANFEAIYKILQEPRHKKEWSRGPYKRDRVCMIACWQSYQDCPEDLLPKDS